MAQEVAGSRPVSRPTFIADDFSRLDGGVTDLDQALTSGVVRRRVSQDQLGKSKNHRQLIAESVNRGAVDRGGRASSAFQVGTLCGP